MDSFGEINTSQVVSPPANISSSISLKIDPAAISSSYRSQYRLGDVHSYHVDQSSMNTIPSNGLLTMYWLLSSHRIIDLIAIWTAIGITTCFSLYYSLHPSASNDPGSRYQIASISGAGRESYGSLSW